MRFSWILLSITFLLICSACREQEAIPEPQNLIDEEIYLDLFVELELLRVSQNELSGFLNIDSLSNLIYEKYDVSLENYLVSHSYYQSKVFEHESRVDTAIERIKRLLAPFNEIDSNAVNQVLPESL